MCLFNKQRYSAVIRRKTRIMLKPMPKIVRQIVSEFKLIFSVCKTHACRQPTTLQTNLYNIYSFITGYIHWMVLI